MMSLSECAKWDATWLKYLPTSRYWANEDDEVMQVAVKYHWREVLIQAYWQKPPWVAYYYFSQHKWTGLSFSFSVCFCADLAFAKSYHVQFPAHITVWAAFDDVTAYLIRRASVRMAPTSAQALPTRSLWSAGPDETTGTTAHHNLSSETPTEPEEERNTEAVRHPSQLDHKGTYYFQGWEPRVNFDEFTAQLCPHVPDFFIKNKNQESKHPHCYIMIRGEYALQLNFTKWVTLFHFQRLSCETTQP